MPHRRSLLVALSVAFGLGCTGGTGGTGGSGPNGPGSPCGAGGCPGQHTVRVTLSPGVGGAVVSQPEGIRCPGACELLAPAGAQVRLTATPAAGFAFSAWSGGAGCAGAAPDGCTLTVDADRAVTATFVQTGVASQELALLDPVAGVAYPVSSGIPFPEGVLTSVDHLRLLDGDGAEVAAHYSEIVKWPDGSVKAALLDFVAAPGMTRYRLEYGPTVAHSDAAPTLSVDTSDPAAVVVTSGHLRVAVGKRTFTLFQQVWLDANGDGAFADSERMLSGPGDVVAVGNYGAAAAQTFRSALAGAADGYSLTIEERGLHKVVLLARGKLKGTVADADGELTFTAFEARLHFWAGSDLVRVYYTLIDPKPRDMNGKVVRAYPPRFGRVLDVQALELRLPLAWATPSYAFGGEGGVHAGQAAGEVHLLQDATRTLREGRITTTFDYSGVGAGGRAAGWFDLSQGTARGVTAGVRHFWQQFPKELGYTPAGQELVVALQPARSARTVPWEVAPNSTRNSLYSLYPGIAKTFETFFYFHAGGAAEARSQAVGSASQQPPLLFDREWFCRSGAFGPLIPDDARQEAYDRIVAGTWLWKDRDGFEGGPGYRVYGNRDFGDYLHTVDEGVPMFGDLHYEDPRGDLLQFVRSGDRKWLENAVAGARHHMDLDVMHVDSVDTSDDVRTEQRGLGPGQIHWHNQYEHEQGGETHEGHMVPGGLAEYVIFSGDRRAQEVLREQGDWLRAYADRGVFDLALPGHEFEEQRSHGWPLHALVESYLGTGDRRYLDGAAILVANALWWWQHPHAHVMQSPNPARWAGISETLDWTRGNSAWITNMRTDNCPEGNFTVSNWMTQYLIWGNLQWLQAVRSLLPTATAYPLTGTYLGATSLDLGQVEEMLVQNTRFVVETQWLDADYTPRYPWLAGYDAHAFVYSPCIQDYPPADGSSDADEVLAYLLLAEARWARVPTAEQAKWRDIAAKMYAKEWTDNTESACYGYNGAPCMMAQPHFLALFF